MGHLTTTGPPWPHQGKIPHSRDTTAETYMGPPWQVSMLPWHGPTPLLLLSHIYSGDTGITHSQKSRVFFHNSAMPAMSSVDAAIDAARRLVDSLSNPVPAAPFAHFCAQTMDFIKQLADIFAATGTPAPTPTPPPRRNRATTPLPSLQVTADPHVPPRVPPAVPSRFASMIPPVPPHRVDPPTINPPHIYPLRSRTWSNHTVDTVGEGAVAFQGVLDPATRKMRDTCR